MFRFIYRIADAVVWLIGVLELAWAALGVLFLSAVVIGVLALLAWAVL